MTPGSTAVVTPNEAARTRSAITISSSAAFPARSPIPFRVHSTWVAPADTPASEFATARPRSLWQCTESSTSSISGARSRTCAIIRPIPSGRAYPTVSGRLITRAPAAIAVRQTAARNSTSDRVASSAENSTSSARSRAYATAKATRSSTCSGVSRSFRSMWRALVAMKTWMRDRGAPRSAAAAVSMSSRAVRARPATVTDVAASDTAATPSKSPGEDAGNPASTTSTPRRSSITATSAFSSGRSAIPGDCSPSLSVVSKILILRTGSSFAGASSGGAPIPFDGGRMRRRGRVSARSPLEGEEDEKRKRERRQQAVRSAREWCSLHLVKQSRSRLVRCQALQGEATPRTPRGRASAPSRARLFELRGVELADLDGREHGVLDHNAAAAVQDGGGAVVERVRDREREVARHADGAGDARSDVVVLQVGACTEHAVESHIRERRAVGLQLRRDDVAPGRQEQARGRRLVRGDHRAGPGDVAVAHARIALRPLLAPVERRLPVGARLRLVRGVVIDAQRPGVLLVTRVDDAGVRDGRERERSDREGCDGTDDDNGELFRTRHSVAPSRVRFE